MAEVARCPKCGKAIDETHENSWCTKCGEPLPEDIKGRLPKLLAIMASVTTDSDAGSLRALSTSPVVSRYRDAYRVGATLVGLGNVIKGIGASLAAIIFFVSLSFVNGQFGGETVLVGVFFAAVVGGLFWVFGVIVTAQGQLFQATLDTAVASSHFLTDTERAEAMGFPRSVVDRSGASS